MSGVLPAGWSGSGSEEFINITPNNGCSGGTATVKAYMNCGSGKKYSNPASININRIGFSSSLGVPSGYTGPKCGVVDLVTFTAANLPCATQYKWTATGTTASTLWKNNGQTGSWLTSTNTIDLTPVGDTPDDATIKVEISIGCTTLTQTYRAIYTNPALATPTFATSSVKVLCSAGSGGVSISSVPQAASYKWYSTDNLLINGVAATAVNPVVTTTLNVNVTAPTSTYVGFVNVRVKAARSNPNCAGSAEGVYPIWMGKPGASNTTLIYPPGKRGVDSVTLATSNTYQFACDFVTGATNYTWLLPTGFSFVSGSTTSIPGIKTSSTVGTYTLYCSANNLCGSSYTHSLGIILSTGGGQQQIAVFPNPADSELNVLVELDSTQQALSDPIDIILINKNQKKVYSTKTTTLHTIIPVSNLPAGNYYLHVTNKDGVIQKQIVIDR